jgi:glutathione peroxidase
MEIEMTNTVDMIKLQRIDGTDGGLGDYAGQVRLIVNVASKCGLTPQYEGLEELYRRYQDKGFAVLGFPSNDFLGQEPGSNEEIAEFCKLTYDVGFPIFAKDKVTGDDKSELYASLIKEMPVALSTSGDGMRTMLAGHGIDTTNPPEVLWNFEKFLIARDGRVVARYAPDTAPDDPALIASIEAALALK